MNILGIVSEYNPFHNGHEYHIISSKAQLGEETPVVCVMSGDFVQRGEPALFSKFARAEAACRCGADLVIELPLPWALSSAEKFAQGAVGLLGALGVSHLSFGSETGETKPLETIAQCLSDESFNHEVKDKMNSDSSLSYAKARQIVAETKLGELALQLELPNNILGVEYLKAIKQLNMKINPITVQRFGSAHDKTGSIGPKSASELRRIVMQGNDITEHIPINASKVYLNEQERGRIQTNRAVMETAIISRLRMFDEEYFGMLPDAADGLGSRLYKAICEETNLDSILAAAKTKRYALARIRRILMCACLAIKAGMNEGIPPYARVLAANEKGRVLLKELGEKSTIPLITKPASVRKLSPECVKLFELGAAAHDFYVLGYKATAEKRGGMDWKTSPKMI